jgi:hypothetical protein
MKDQIASWTDFIGSNFDLIVPTDLRIPETRRNFDCLIVLPPIYQLDLKKIFKVCQENFRITNGTPWRNLDRTITNQFRDYKNWRAVWTRDSREADNHLVGLDQLRISKMNINVMDIFERLLLELFVVQVQKRGHLDQKRWTRCDHSITNNGQILAVSSTGCRHGGVRIGLSHTDPQNQRTIGVREVHF